ncbi:MAG: hypothetical protein JST16_03870 [Bdellovibrionales bacterium]|nr:hypothetical protein [Bdellovibrionales bacterium]
MKSLKPAELAFWNEYVSTLAESERPHAPSVHAACAGSPAVTDELLALYLQGKKTAGSSILEDFVSCGDPVPKVGDFGSSWIAPAAPSAFCGPSTWF